MRPLRSNPNNRDRARAERAGRWAETLGAFYVRALGYRILARRFKTPLGEIDLIARRGRTLVFIEVKQRAGAMRVEMALGAVNRDRITRAAQWFLSRNARYGDFDCRFDVIVVAPWRLPHHLKNAFPAA